MIDSTDPDVIEGSSMHKFLVDQLSTPLILKAMEVGLKNLAPQSWQSMDLPAIALCIGPKGMAKTPQEKLETAELAL